MNQNQNIEVILNDIDVLYGLVHGLINESELDLSNEYKKINHTYFRMFCCHFESFFILIKSDHFSSAILLLRTMLELYVKSYYFEFIEKDKGSRVIDFLNGAKDFPSFFKMTQELEKCKNSQNDSFEGAFKQFTKNELASYEKFSLFSHGRGEILKAFYEYNRLSYTTEQITDVLLTSKGLFETLSLLLFFVQNQQQKFGVLLERIKPA